MNDANTCVACGKGIPEGNHVCFECLLKASKAQPVEKKIEFHEDTPKGCMALTLGFIAVFLVAVAFWVDVAILLPWLMSF